MSKYRIMECKNSQKKWFEVQKKGWFYWNTESIILDYYFPLSSVSIPIEFKTYEESKKYIMDKIPKVPIEEEPINRSVYETFY